MKLIIRIQIPVILFLALITLSCARIYPPAERENGPIPAPVLQPAAMSHVVVEGVDCAVCHREDVKFVASMSNGHPVPVPPGFTKSPAEACILCHQSEQVEIEAPTMPHGLAGMEECALCHSNGTSGIPQMPSDPLHQSGHSCILCHTPLQATKVTPTPTTSSTTTPNPSQPDAASTSTPTATAEPESKTPAQIPHALEGMGNCLSCHSGQAPIASLMPSDHASYQVSTCTLCHTVANKNK